MKEKVTEQDLLDMGISQDLLSKAPGSADFVNKKLDEAHRVQQELQRVRAELDMTKDELFQHILTNYSIDNLSAYTNSSSIVPDMDFFKETTSMSENILKEALNQCPTLSGYQLVASMTLALKDLVAVFDLSRLEKLNTYLSTLEPTYSDKILYDGLEKEEDILYVRRKSTPTIEEMQAVYKTTTEQAG